jgi:hypothetical protein
MSGLHFPWVPCPKCGGSGTHDTAADDAPAFKFECVDCGHTWETFGFGVSLGSQAVERHSK